MKLSLKKVTSEYPGLKTFHFEAAEPLTWQAGQYTHLTLPHDPVDDRGDSRWFTVSSAPSEHEICITTRIFGDKASSFKKALQNLPTGQEFEAADPEGDFVVTDPSLNYIFVAGGIGITPMRSIIRELDNTGKDLKIQLLYANRNEAEVPFKAELEEIAGRHQSFTITYFTGEHRIDEAALKTAAANTTDGHFYVSGPEPMTEAFEKTLRGMGVDDAHLQLDFFPGYEAE